jgi:hypothetical protein
MYAALSALDLQVSASPAGMAIGQGTKVQHSAQHRPSSAPQQQASYGHMYEGSGGYPRMYLHTPEPVPAPF